MSALPTSWVDIKLSEVAQVTSGVGFPNEYQGHTSGDLPFFKVSDISHAVLANRGELETANHYVTYEIAEKLKGKPLVWCLKSKHQIMVLAARATDAKMVSALLCHTNGLGSSL